MAGVSSGGAVLEWDKGKVSHLDVGLGCTLLCLRLTLDRAFPQPSEFPEQNDLHPWLGSEEADIMAEAESATVT